MPKPACISCQRFLRPHKNGVYFIESAPKDGVRAAPGHADPGLWYPYKVWCGDLWKCQGCGVEIIMGAGLQPVAIHHMKDFVQTINNTGACDIVINDC